MIHKNHDPLWDDLRKTLPEGHRKLIGRAIQIEFQIEELEFLEWAFKAFEAERIIGALAESAASLASGRVYDDMIGSDIRRELDKVLSSSEYHRLVLERLRSKMASAIEAALHDADNQPPLDLH